MSTKRYKPFSPDPSSPSPSSPEPDWCREYSSTPTPSPPLKPALQKIKDAEELAGLKQAKKERDVAIGSLRRLGREKKVPVDPYYQQNLYAAITQNRLIFKKKKTVALSFRQAGHVLAEVFGKGSYLDWYCSGATAVTGHQQAIIEGQEQGPVVEGTVTDAIRRDLKRVGCKVVECAML